MESYIPPFGMCAIIHPTFWHVCDQGAVLPLAPSAAAGSHSSINDRGRFKGYPRNPSLALAGSRDGQGRRHM
jgi:hypothetical protein